MSKKMTTVDVVRLIKKFADDAGYVNVTVENVQPNDGNWLVQISGAKKLEPGLSLSKTFLVNGDTQDISFVARVREAKE